jgi:microcin C transport system substrate-binding protein
VDRSREGRGAGEEDGKRQLSGACGIGRRGFLVAAGAAVSLPFLGCAGLARTATGVRLHGLSAFGELKYDSGFTHFDYANPEAPKGGTFRFSPPNWAFNQNVMTFNTLNSFVARGDAPPRMEMCFDSLMTRALDEPDAVYGLLAESVEISEDRNRFIFHLRPEARFHDGTPLTAEDCAFTFRIFRERGHSSLLLPLRELEDAIATDAHRLELRFTGGQSARTILNVVQFPIVSKAFYSAFPFDSSEMRAPLGSGPYRVSRVAPGLSIEYERVGDYWGADLPVNRGLGHFDRIRIDFFRDRQAAFEAFKKGEIDYRQEFTSKTWATEYDFPAVASGKVVRREFPGELRPSMQAWAINARRERFADRRVREAISLCFDFEWTRQNLFYGAYTRSHSLFERSPYRAEGLPSAAERKLLDSLPGDIPEAAFGPAVTLPESDGSGRDRKLLGKAVRLLGEAGWRRSGAFFADAKGNRLALEILIDAPVFERIFMPFVENLRAIGIDATLRLVDAAQYQARQNEFDFDMVSIASSFSATPTDNELAQFFHSRSAGLAGSRNLPGTADEAIDALIAAVGRAGDRESLMVAMRVLDRILRARLDWIPNWHAANHRAAYWDLFGFREPKPDYGFPVETLWWHDAEKVKAIGRA